MTATDLQTLNARLDRIESISLMGAKTVLDLDEAVLFTGLSKGQLYRLTSGREVPHYKRGRKIYFKKAELEAWMLETEVPTTKDTQRLATTYCKIHKKRI